MELLKFENYSTGVQRSEITRLILYGEPGIGLSSLMSYLKKDKTLILDAEHGSLNLDVQRLSIVSDTQVYDAVKAICNHETHFGLTSVIIDGWDSLEEMMVERILDQHDAQVLDEVAGGFGAGKVIAAQDVRTLLALLDCLIDCGISVIIIGHQIDAYTEIMTGSEKTSYDRITINTINKKTGPILMEWADAVLYAGSETVTIRNCAGVQETETRRMLYTAGNSVFDAKNRIGLPEKLPLSVEALQLIMKTKKKEDTESAEQK